MRYTEDETHRTRCWRGEEREEKESRIIPTFEALATKWMMVPYMEKGKTETGLFGHRDSGGVGMS